MSFRSTPITVSYSSAASAELCLSAGKAVISAIAGAGGKISEGDNNTAVVSMGTGADYILSFANGTDQQKGKLSLQCGETVWDIGYLSLIANGAKQYKAVVRVAQSDRAVNIKIRGGTTASPYFNADILILLTDSGVRLMAYNSSTAATPRPFAALNPFYVGVTGATAEICSRLLYIYDDAVPPKVETVSGKIFLSGGQRIFECRDLTDCSEVSGGKLYPGNDGKNYFAVDDHTLMEV